MTCVSVFCSKIHAHGWNTPGKVNMEKKRLVPLQPGALAPEGSLRRTTRRPGVGSSRATLMIPQDPATLMPYEPHQSARK